MALTLPLTQKNIDDVAISWGYDNPMTKKTPSETKTNFVIRLAILKMKRDVSKSKGSVAVALAEKNAKTQVESDFG